MTVGGTARAPHSARRFSRACVSGALPAVAVFTWLVGNGHGDLLQRRVFGNFYDLQARALFRGRWNVPNGSLAFEGIINGGRTYEYYGPFPALLRMPVLLATHRFDGRLTQLSMILAFSVALFGASRILWRVRTFARPGAAVTSGEWWIVAAWIFVVGAGTVLLFPGSVAIIYHEAELWGAALALVGIDAVIGAAIDPSPRRLALASTVAAGALLARPSVGSAPAAALGFVALGTLLPTPAGRDLHRRIRAALPVALAAVTAVAIYVAVNLAKFSTPFSTPFSQQIFSRFNANRQATLRANGGSLFNVRYLGTTVLQYFRPDALRAWHLLPFVDFTTWRASALLGTRFDEIDRSSSITATMPGLCVLAVFAVVMLIRHQLTSAPTRALVAAMLGGVVAVLPTLTIGFIANRYLIDFLPLVLVPACVGLELLVGVDARARSTGRGALVAGVAVLLVFGVWVNVALASTYSHLYAAPNQSVRRGFVGFQESVARALGVNGYAVVHAARLGRPRADTIAVIGDCVGLYWANGTATWQPLELGPDGVHVRLEIDPHRITSSATALVQIGSGADRYAVSLRRVRERSWQVQTVGVSGRRQVADPFPAPGRGKSVIDVELDRQLRFVDVEVDGQRAFAAAGQVIPPGQAALASTARPLPVRTPLCARMTR